jgi:hypothetical protein
MQHRDMKDRTLRPSKNKKFIEILNRLLVYKKCSINLSDQLIYSFFVKFSCEKQEHAQNLLDNVLKKVVSNVINRLICTDTKF